MLNRLLLLCALSVLIISCSTPDSDTQPVGSLADTCLLTSIQYDSLNTDSIVYDSVTFLPKYTLRNGVIERIYTYSNNEYKIVTLERNGTDTSSLEIFTIDADKKATRIFTKKKQLDESILFINQNYTYNIDNTIKAIRSIRYRFDIDGNQAIIGLPNEQRFTWINGNLASDSNFNISNMDTPQETKSLFQNTIIDHNNSIDIKGLSTLNYYQYKIPGLFGKGSRNLVSKARVYLGDNIISEVENKYELNGKGWVTSVTSTGNFNNQTGNYLTKYGYTCFKRK